MKTLLNIYGGKLKKITAIVKEDLVGSVTVKIVRGRMELDSVEELKKFMEMVESADYTNIFDNMRKSLHGFLDRCKGDVNVQLKYEVDDVLTQYRKEYQSTLNIKIREFILKEIKSTDLHDGSKTCGVYNFTDTVLGEDTSVARLEVNKDKNYPKNIKDIHSQIRIYGCQLVYLYCIYLVYR